MNSHPRNSIKNSQETPKAELKCLGKFKAADAGTIALYLDCLNMWPAKAGSFCFVPLKELLAIYCLHPGAVWSIEEVLARIHRLTDFGLVERLSDVPPVFFFREPTEAQLLLFAMSFRLASEQLLAADAILSGGYATCPDDGNVSAAIVFLKTFRACVVKLQAVAPTNPWLAWLQAGGHHNPEAADAIELAAVLFDHPKN